ncbi:MAG: WbqC family protein, partial [Paludibacter sp.]
MGWAGSKHSFYGARSLICAIMQPTYLPWAGYFNLIAQADVFVFLDDAQFQKNSWHNRNRLLVNHVPHWITVPVKRNFLGQRINETEIDSTQNWRVKQSKLLQQTYSKHPFPKDVQSICSVIEQNAIEHLAEFNIFLIRWVLNQLDIQTEIQLSSEMSVEGKRTDRLIELLQQVHADCYLSPKGAMDYLEKDE